MNMDIHTHKIVSRCAADLKWPNIPGGSTKSSADEADELESCSSALSICTHMHDISDSSIRHLNMGWNTMLTWRGTKLHKDGAGAPLRCIRYMQGCEECYRKLGCIC